MALPMALLDQTLQRPKFEVFDGYVQLWKSDSLGRTRVKGRDPVFSGQAQVWWRSGTVRKRIVVFLDLRGRENPALARRQCKSRRW